MSYYIILGLSFLLVAAIIRGNMHKRKQGYVPPISPAKAHQLLLENVRYYARLNPDEQAEFRTRAKDFLEHVIISPVGDVKITTLDRIYVAAAAIIPIFRHKGWAYNHLNEVLIYPGNFSKDFEQDPESANVMGMVGDGAMHRMMVLSIGALRAGFEQAGRGNTGIHEFVHLLDKADGAVDGVPDALLPEELARPWAAYMHRAIQDIQSGKSDINPYGATSEAEFFAVVSEYFFQRPEAMAEKHPELMDLLTQIYKEPEAVTQEDAA